MRNASSPETFDEARRRAREARGRPGSHSLRRRVAAALRSDVDEDGLQMIHASTVRGYSHVPIRL
ncbi:MAG: hypothetical protein GY772_19655 [bacterium]|nr:hypothetical protein [bacterium]